MEFKILFFVLFASTIIIDGTILEINFKETTSIETVTISQNTYFQMMSNFDQIVNKIKSVCQSNINQQNQKVLAIFSITNIYGKMIKRETEYQEKIEVLDIASWYYHQSVGYEPTEFKVMEYFNQIHLHADQIVSNGFNVNDWLYGLFKCANCPTINYPSKCKYVDPLKLIIEILDNPPPNNQQTNRMNLVNNINNQKPILDVPVQDESNTEDASDIVYDEDIMDKDDQINTMNQTNDDDGKYNKSNGNNNDGKINGKDANDENGYNNSSIINDQSNEQQNDDKVGSENKFKFQFDTAQLFKFSINDIMTNISLAIITYYVIKIYRRTQIMQDYIILRNETN